MKIIKLSLATLLALLLSQCKKEPTETTTPVVISTTGEILSSFSVNLAQATYSDLNSKTDLLYQSILLFQGLQTDPALITCKQAWRDSRSAWEQSEGFLFGPVSTKNIDPRIDTWPVAFSRLDSVLKSTTLFSATYIDSLEDALKGFHPIEYLLFGQNGNKTAAQFTSREMDYLKALALNLKVLTKQLSDSWSPATTGNYTTVFNTAGSGNTTYPTQRVAFKELVNAMAGICDEVANGKLLEPFTQNNPSLEESPFSFNSITDFTNNIKSVQNVYLGNYTTDGKGLEDLVREHKLSLDGTIKTKINIAIASLQNITVPFGQAITAQPTQIQNAISAINDLKEEIENNLMPFVQTYTN